MRILFLTQILPYPPNAGPRVKSWYVLQHLSASGAEIHMATFIRPEEVEYLPVVKSLCKEVITIPIKRSRIRDGAAMLKSFLTGKPFLIERDNLIGMRSAIYDLVKQNDFDVIHTDQLSMAQYGWMAKLWQQTEYTTRRPPFLIFDAHNATWTIMDRMRSHVTSLLRPLITLEKKKIQKYENWLITNFDHTLAVSTIDKSALLCLQPSNLEVDARISVIPIAVDTNQIKPVVQSDQTPEILTVGTLHYPPNADGIRWFMNNVFSFIIIKNPTARLTIVGKNPPSDFFDIASKYPGRINITGYVEDLIPYFKKAGVLVVPVLAGGGMRVRILEGFARQLAVVTTTVGLEGIEAIDGKEVIVKDKPEDMAKAINFLLESPESAKKIALAGRDLVVKKYDWQKVFLKLDQVYENAKVSER